MDLQNDICIFYPKTLLKHSKPHKTKDVFVYNKFDDEQKLCPIATINEYIKRRIELKPTNTSLFITSVPPYKTPHKDTLSRWIKDLMHKSGVDTIVFKPHSCRSASTSKGKCHGLGITDILKQASWSNVNTFLNITIYMLFYQQHFRLPGPATQNTAGPCIYFSCVNKHFQKPERPATEANHFHIS